MRAALLLFLALAACGPERGAGVYPEPPDQRQARDQAEFEKGERLGLDGLRSALIALGIREEEMNRVLEPDHGIATLQLDIEPARLAEVDVQALARLVLDSNFRLTFANPATDRALPVAEEIFRRDMQQAIAELKSHDDWDRIPRLDKSRSLADLARRIEDWCDFDPGAALRVIDGQWLGYTQAPVSNAVAEPVPGGAAARFDCLRRVVYATQLRGHFIGYRGEAPPPVYR